MQKIWQPKQWERIIARASKRRPIPIEMVEFRHKWDTDSKPAILVDAFRQEYVVKALQIGHSHIHRVIVSEQIVGHIGIQIGAAVGVPVLIHVPQSLIDMNPSLQEPYSFRPGTAHGSVRLPDCTDRGNFGQFESPENRFRSAMLAVLYGLLGCFADHQVIYEKQPPNRVYSVDHGHFFSGGPLWTTDTLRDTPLVEVDATITQQCGLTEQDIMTARCSLQALQNKHIAYAIAMPPDEWQFPITERGEMAYYIANRRDQLLAH